MNAKEVSQPEYTETNLSIFPGGQVLTRITHPCLSVESDQLSHTFGKSWV